MEDCAHFRSLLGALMQFVVIFIDLVLHDARESGYFNGFKLRPLRGYVRFPQNSGKLFWANTELPRPCEGACRLAWGISPLVLPPHFFPKLARLWPSFWRHHDSRQVILITLLCHYLLAIVLVICGAFEWSCDSQNSQTRVIQCCVSFWETFFCKNVEEGGLKQFK